MAGPGLGQRNNYQVFRAASSAVQCVDWDQGRLLLLNENENHLEGETNSPEHQTRYYLLTC